MSFSYLASPYSHPDSSVRERRYVAVKAATAKLLARKVWVFSPIVHCHELAKVCDLPRDSSFWEKYNFVMLGAAEYLYQLMIPGWHESIGCKAEWEEAKRLGIPVIQYEPKEHILS